MLKRKYTIMVVPDGQSKIRQIRMPRLMVVLLAVFFVLSGAALTWFGKDYISLKAKMPGVAHLVEENAKQKEQFLHLAARMDKLLSKMHKLRQFDQKLKVMVNPDLGEKSEQYHGLGGSGPFILVPENAVAGDHKKMVRLMHRSLDKLEDEAAISAQDKYELHKLLEEQKTLLASTPSIWPTKGWLSSSFGKRLSPFTGRNEFHKGIDISTRIKSPVIAPADGIVSDTRREYGYGRILCIKHGYGIMTKYAHLNKALVKVGQHVKRGETIALVGNTGRSTGPHLHYEVVLNGVAVNPLRYILN